MQKCEFHISYTFFNEKKKVEFDFCLSTKEENENDQLQRIEDHRSVGG
jgi:hypothetical protein